MVRAHFAKGDHYNEEGRANLTQIVGEALRNKDASAFPEVMTVIQRTGGLDATREAALKHRHKAIDALDVLDHSSARENLRQMAMQAVDRPG